jgi:hypothetical protein
MNVANSFSNWLASEANDLKVKFNIKGSPRVPGGLDVLAVGLEEVLGCYRWRSKWADGDRSYISDKWDTTKISLTALKEYICRAVDSGDQEHILRACKAVLAWGGDRSGCRAGALPFLKKLLKQRNDDLVAYLTRIKEILSLDNDAFERIAEVQCMNAMMTKIHALLADDGLPIYDSRVAGASGALVELYRRRTGQNWNCVPDELAFPSTDRRRTARRLAEDAVSPGHIYYGHPDTAVCWAKAKIKLGRVMRAALAANPELFGAMPANSRMHALEATFFMIGYDTSCLSPNLE